MTSINLYFQVHQPYRIKEFTFFDIGQRHLDYFNTPLNKEILSKVAYKCYLPTNKLLLHLIRKHEGKFKCNFSISGITIEQLAQDQPSVMESFIELHESGCVNFLTETFHHSLASIFSQAELESQVQLHQNIINKYFGVTPTVFRNTELIFHKSLIPFCLKHKFDSILAEGAEKFLNNHTPHQIYNIDGINIFCRDFELSDEIAYRFSDPNSKNHPLTPTKFHNLLIESSNNATTGNLNLYMDYETFGEHQWKETGIFNFLEDSIDLVLAKNKFKFSNFQPEGIQNNHKLNLSITTSWADKEKDITAWVKNDMQKEAIDTLYSLSDKVYTKGCEKILDIWRKLQTSDHFYYMSTKGHSDGEVHSYFSPFRTPHDAYLFYMNILKDLKIKLGVN